MCPLIEARVLYLCLYLIMMGVGVIGPEGVPSRGGWLHLQLLLGLLIGRL